MWVCITSTMLSTLGMIYKLVADNCGHFSSWPIFSLTLVTLTPTLYHDAAAGGAVTDFTRADLVSLATATAELVMAQVKVDHRRPSNQLH